MHRKTDIKNKSPDSVIEELMEKYMGFVYSIVYKKIKTVAADEDIEETVSDVFIKVYNSLDTFDSSKSSLKTFVAAIASNTAIDKYRYLLKRINISNEQLCEIQDVSSDIENKYIKKEEQKRVFDAILALKEPDRTIVFRRYYLDETFVRIAREIGYSPNATEKRLKRALEKLRKELGGDF